MANTEHPHSIWIGNGNINCNNVLNSNNTVNVNEVIADKSSGIMQWLSPLDSKRRHQDARIERINFLCNQFLETSKFRKWRSDKGGAEKSVLFCYRYPGVGKRNPR